MQESPQRNSLSSVISDALARGATILAPNERAAADLRARFDRSQSAAGLDAWEPAEIRSWNAWLESLWNSLVNQGAELRLLLNPPQEHTLWREIIAASTAAPSLGSPDSLAELAQTAWRLAASYEATADLRRSAITHDSKTFATWATAFAKRCERGQFLSAAELPAAIREHIANASLTPPPSLLLIGFDDDTPARTSLLTTLEAHGCTIDRLAITTETTSLRTIVRAANPHEELVTAAHWIRHFIESTPSLLSPSSLAPQQNPQPPRIALIVPNLGEERPTLEATLRSILTPELQSIDADLSSTPYTFSTGSPLAETPMVATALDLIRWLTGPLPLDRVTTLLLSPYIGAFADLEARAAFDAFTLRRTPLLRPEIDIARLNRLAATSPAVARILAPLTTRLAPTTLRSHADWMEFVRDTLRDANFPGDRPLTAQEFRDARTWDHVLDAVATLDFTGVRVDFRTALEALTRQARATSSSQGNNDASVQIMTPTEAAGSSFDAVVFLHATDTNWPPPTRTNPFLGWPLQHDRHIPGTDSARTAARAAEATQRFLACAPSVLFFYAAEDENGPQRLSPIVDRLNWPQIRTADLITPTPEPSPITLDEIEDTAPLPPLTSPSVRGGSLVLKLQAACGFRAFAEMRLNASAIDSAQPGFDVRQTGIFLHATMDRFWNAVQTQAALKSMPTTERIASLQAAIEKSLPREVSPDGPWDEAYITVQKDRMRTLLLQWLDRELQRSPFTVTEREQKKEVNVGPLTLHLRMDRVDEVEGGTLLVDYKTGLKSSPKDWEGERPEDPQLPLYSLLPESGTLQGIAFAKVRPGKDMKWLGYSESGQIPKPASMEHANLAEQIEAWRYVLEQLANDFNSGKANVSPKEYPFTCTHCSQRLLCRLDVAAFTTDDEETETSDAE